MLPNQFTQYLLRLVGITSNENNARREGGMLALKFSIQNHDSLLEFKLQLKTHMENMQLPEQESHSP